MSSIISESNQSHQELMMKKQSHSLFVSEDNASDTMSLMGGQNGGGVGANDATDRVLENMSGNGDSAQLSLVIMFNTC
jgi:hypothetical protein